MSNMVDVNIVIISGRDVDDLKSKVIDFDLDTILLRLNFLL